MARTLFFIDHSALKDMFEGKKKGVELLKKITKLSHHGVAPDIKTSMSCFLRAVFLVDPKLNVNIIQKTLNFLQIFPSFADFKSEKAVTDEVVLIVKRASEKNG